MYKFLERIYNYLITLRGVDSDTLETLSDQLDGIAGGIGSATIEKQNTIMDGTTDLSGGYVPGTDNLHDMQIQLVAIPTTMVGTNDAALASSWTAGLATALGNYTAARAVFLDELAAANLPADIDTLKTAIGSEFDGTPNQYDVQVTGYVTAVTRLAVGSILERLQLLQDSNVFGNTIFVADSATVNTIVDAALSTTELYKGMTIIPLSGVMASVARTISDYDGSTKTITVTPDWPASPSTASYIIIPRGEALFLDESGHGLQAISSTINSFPQEGRVADNPTATGAEDVLYIQNSPSAIIVGVAGTVSLENMVAGDEITLRLYTRIESGGALELVDEESYANAQDVDIVPVWLRTPNRFGWKITLEQTAGTYRVFPWEFYYGS